jgi:WD40 repeat protein
MKRTCLLVIALLTLAACAASRPPDHERAFSSVAFSPDHSLLAFADAVEIRVLEVETRALVNVLRQLPQDTEGADPLYFRHGVGDTMVFLDNHRIATTGMGGLVSIWDIRSGSRLSVIDPPTAEAFASTLDFSPFANRLIVGTGDGELLLAHLSGDVAGPLMPAALTFRPEACIRSVAISPDGQTIVSTTRGPSHNVMAVIDRASDKVVDKWTADVHVCDMEFSPDGKYLLTANATGVLIYDTVDWKKTNLKDIGAK